ncbi:hypothetical protein ALC62_07645, partial [Cyphomyrmex costatus]
ALMNVSNQPDCRYYHQSKSYYNNELCIHTSVFCSTGLLFSGCTNSHPPESDTSPLSFSILDESEMYA